MRKSVNKAELLAYSINEAGHRIGTFRIETNVATFMQIATSRSATKNAASKRAIPTKKQINAVLSNGFLPTSYWKNQAKGMQPSEQFELVYQAVLDDMMVEHLENTVEFAQKLNNLNVTRQQVGNLLMPFQVITAIFTFPEYGMENFFRLRCGHHTGSQQEISELACMMRDLWRETEPKLLKYGEWHIPFSTEGLTHQQNIEKSVACIAHASYDTIEKQRPLESYKKLHDRLLEQKHESCFQHACMAMSDGEFYESFKGFISLRELRKQEERPKSHKEYRQLREFTEDHGYNIKEYNWFNKFLTNQAHLRGRPISIDEDEELLVCRQDFELASKIYNNK